MEDDVRQITDYKTCEKCNGPCQLLRPPSRPQAAEWYCEKCHKSYPVYEPESEEEKAALET